MVSLKMALNQISGIGKLDQLSRVYVLEGVLGVKVGSLAKKPKQSLLKIQDKLPNISKEWTNLQESNFVRSSLKGLYRFTQNTNLDVQDLFFQAMLEKKGQYPNRLYYIGQTNADKISNGNMSPVQAGAIYRKLLQRKALDEIKKTRRRQEVSLNLKIRGEEGVADIERDLAHTVSFQDSNVQTNILVSMLMDSSSPLSNELYRTLDEVIDRYPFEKIKNSPENKSLAKFLSSFANKHRRMPVDKIKQEALLWLADNPSTKNMKVRNELEKTSDEKVVEFSTQRGLDPDLRRKAYKAFLQILRKYQPQEWSDTTLREFKKDPEKFWKSKFSKINREVAISLGILTKENYATAGDTSMTRILGIGGRNVLAFFSKLVSKNKKIQAILDKAISAIDPEWGYSRKQANRTQILQKKILKVAARNEYFRKALLRYYSSK